MMKRLNFIVILFVGALSSLFVFNWNYSTETMIFYGFAHNKELNINLEHPSLVKAIYVKPGQRVSKGDILIEVARSSIEVSQNDIDHDISRLQTEYQIWKSGLKNSISILKSQKIEMRNELQTAISKLESEMEINISLIKEIESIAELSEEYNNNPRKIELNGLKADLRLSMNTFDSEIRKLERELYSPENPLLIEIEKLGFNLDFVSEEEKNLNIRAPNDGVIGSILSKIGEHISSFTPYLTMYEETPNHVKAFVQESLILKVNLNDTLTIQSVSHPEESVEGIVIGMGSRIVELPSRIRKNPNFASYGREVEIKIPSQNPFLQNEKVILKKQTRIKRLSLRELALSKNKIL